MTDVSRKRAVNKAIKCLEHDRNIKKEYLNFWSSLALIYSGVGLIYFIFYSVIKAVCRPIVYSGWLLGLGFVDIILTCLMLICMSSSYRYSNGRPCNTFFGILLRMWCFFCSMIPMMYLVYYFNYDISTDTCTAPLWKIMIGAPLVFGVLLLVSLFMGTTGVYSNTVDCKGNQRMTKLDWMTMRQEQEIAGLDPDKMPVVLSPNQIKSMTKLDWHTLGMDLEIAGYDVFKDNKNRK